MTDIKSTKTTKPAKVKKNRNIGLIIKVSLFWITLAALALAFVKYGELSYNRGVFDGMEKTKAILQVK